MTALLRIEDPRASLITGKMRGRLEVYPADQASTVMVDGQPQPLEVDPTAALHTSSRAIRSMASRLPRFSGLGWSGARSHMTAPRMGSSSFSHTGRGRFPWCWCTERRRARRAGPKSATSFWEIVRIRERYQIWTFLYDSGNPIGYSAGRLRGALATTVQELDPEGKDPALHRMVVIGHSQGGLLTKLTAIDSGTRFWDNISDKPFEDINVNPETRALLRRTVFYTPLPFVKRVIFIATPHRGALMAGNFLGRMAAGLVTLPATVVRQFGEAATASGDEKLLAVLRRPPTAVDNMNPRHVAIRTLASIRVDPNIQAHSIIAVEGDGPKEKGDDGVVAYRSAHIDEAVSELVVRSDHSVQGHPAAIEEVRRILLEHAAVPGDARP